MDKRFKEGDLISYTVSKRSGRSITISCRTGKFVGYITGNLADVKSKNGRVLTVSVSGIRMQGERGALTESIMGKSND